MPILTLVAFNFGEVLRDNRQPLAVQMLSPYLKEEEEEGHHQNDGYTDAQPQVSKPLHYGIYQFHFINYHT